MDAFVTAGGIPEPDEPLHAEAGGQPKALIDVAGRPMIQWVLDALGGASQVGQIVLVGLAPDSGLTCARPLHFLPNQGGMLANIQAGMARLRELNPHAEHALAVSTDIPAITPAMVDWLIDHVRQSDHDLYYCVIERQTMERRFPESRRSFVRFRDVEVCGGDMNAVRLSLAADAALWNRLVAARKHALRQAAMVGWDLVLLMLLRRLTLAQAEQRICQRLGLRGRIVPCPHAEIGMDVDKPHQLELLRRDLAARRAAA